MAIDLKKFTHKTRCDIYGCKNLADVSLGDEKYPAGYRMNICKCCLQQIVIAAPREMIYKRVDAKDIAQSIVDTPDVAVIEYEDLSMQEVRRIAKAKGLSIPVGFTKVEAIVAIKNCNNTAVAK